MFVGSGEVGGLFCDYIKLVKMENFYFYCLI